LNKLFVEEFLSKRRKSADIIHEINQKFEETQEACELNMKQDYKPKNWKKGNDFR
jgi:hypothetical protein